MASEIVKRYYYEKGELIQNLKKDEVLNKALEVLSAPALMEKTLMPLEKPVQNFCK
jgi:carboxyl-terminal processing protease